MEAKRTTVNERILKLQIVEKRSGNDDGSEAQLDPLTPIGGDVLQATVGDVEGYRPLYGNKEQGKDKVSDADRNEGLAGETSYVLSDKDVDEQIIQVLSPQEDVKGADEELTEDQKVWREIFGENSALPGSDEEEEIGKCWHSDGWGVRVGLISPSCVDVKAEMNSILSQNYFLYMWTTLEDLFDCEVMSWMNGEDLMPRSEGADSVSVPSNIDAEENYCDPNDHRRVLSTTSQNVAQSLSTLLHRAVQQAEKSVNLLHFFPSSSLSSPSSSSSSLTLFTAKEGREYHQSKHMLLSMAQVRRANPAFSSAQWAFLGLLLVDALVVRRVLKLTGDFRPCVGEWEEASGHSEEREERNGGKNKEREVHWSNAFSLAAQTVLGGEAARNRLIDSRELTNLRCFFYVDN